MCSMTSWRKFFIGKIIDFKNRKGRFIPQGKLINKNIEIWH